MNAEDFVMWAMGIGLTVFLFVCSLLFVGMMAGWWLQP
jgi:hypothetical protein